MCLSNVSATLTGKIEQSSCSVGRVLDSGSKGHEFEIHQSKTLYPLLSTGLRQEIIRT